MFIAFFIGFSFGFTLAAILAVSSDEHNHNNRGRR